MCTLLAIFRYRLTHVFCRAILEVSRCRVIRGSSGSLLWPVRFGVRKILAEVQEARIRKATQSIKGQRLHILLVPANEQLRLF